MSFLLLWIISWNAQAHQIGDQEWCLAYTPYHRECVYHDSLPCSETLKSTQKFFKNNQSSLAKILTENPDPKKASMKDFDLHCEPNLANPASNPGYKNGV